MGIAHAEGRFVSVNGKQLWVETLGQGEPLLLIAGGPGASHDYMHAYDMLGEGRRLIFFDALGTGRSERSEPASYTLERSISDLEGLRAALGIQAWDVFGHSFGGFVGGVYACQHRPSLRRLIISNSALSGRMFQDAMDCVNEAIRQLFPEAWERSQALRARGLAASDPEHLKAFEVPTEVVYWFNGENAARAIFDINMDVLYQVLGRDADFTIAPPVLEVDFRAELAKLDLPILILGGRYDRQVTPRLLREYQRAIPNARLHFFERSGHQPALEEPDATAEVVLGFLAT